MKYALRGITAEEISYTMNKIKVDKDTRFEIKPQFSRTIRQVKENEKLWFVTMEVKVESTESEPKPFNLKVRLVGMFEAEDVNTAEDKQVLAISTTEIIYPYLRAAVSALTANAFINPLMLPVIPAGTMFPEDRGEAPSQDLN
jgi:preprotein translocase subunit SecB